MTQEAQPSRLVYRITWRLSSHLFQVSRFVWPGTLQTIGMRQAEPAWLQ